MIIRSQDKAFIINFEKVDTVCLGGIEGKSVITFTDAQVVTLGTYSTEAKAIKVLDMIQEAYSRMEDIKCGAVQAQKYDSFCFQMPDDEDVEV